MLTGEFISLGVAISWTITALCFEYASKRMGVLSLNVLRLALAILMLGTTLYVATGNFIPVDAGGKAWFWLGLSGFVGYVFGDYCLFSSYIVIGSRFGQLFMTLAPPSAAIAGWFILGERMSLYAVVGMLVTMLGIALSIIGKPDGNAKGKRAVEVKLPLKGILLGIGAGLGQGIGIVLSKLGMEYYSQAIGEADSAQTFLLPFAATQIRAIVGVVGFACLLLMSGQGSRLIRSLGEVRTMFSASLGTFFGPFIGVSFSLMAVQYTATGIASTIMAITPILILAPSYYFFKQKVSLKEVIGAVISVIGVALFFVEDF
jgi:drug/metabolite transporter (DMT)-like permease